jgi:hypothetical protein
MKSCRRTGKTAAVAALVVLGAAAWSGGAAAQQSDPEHPSTEHPSGTEHPSSEQPSIKEHPTGQQTPGAAAAAALVTSSATVEKIDKDKGLITLKGAGGKSLDVKAGPGINLDKLRVGDRVNTAYFDEVAVDIRNASPGAPTMTTKAVQRAGVTAMQSTVTSRIIHVDAAKNTVTIKGPKAEEHTLKVTDPDLQSRLKDVKPGDKLDVTYTQAVAVSVEPAKKAEPSKTHEGRTNEQPKTNEPPKTEPPKTNERPKTNEPK